MAASATVLRLLPWIHAGFAAGFTRIYSAGNKSPSESKSDDVQRRIHVNQRRPGSKARELEAMRRANKAKISNEKQDDLAWDGKFDAIYSTLDTQFRHSDIFRHS